MTAGIPPGVIFSKFVLLIALVWFLVQGSFPYPFPWAGAVIASAPVRLSVPTARDATDVG